MDFAKIEYDWRIYDLRDPDFWGSKFWDFLYLMALGLPVSLSNAQSLQVSSLLKNFHNFLPCIHCRYHYYNIVKNKEYSFQRKDEVLREILDVHNSVRIRLKKTPLEENSVVDHFFSRQNNTTYDKFFFATCVVATVAFILVKLNSKSR